MAEVNAGAVQSPLSWFKSRSGLQPLKAASVGGLFHIKPANGICRLLAHIGHADRLPPVRESSCRVGRWSGASLEI
jgi:hypothetical protein